MIDLVEDVEQYESKGIERKIIGNEFYQQSRTNIEQAFLINEYSKLKVLSDTGFAPKPDRIDVFAGQQNGLTVVEYLGKSEPVTDEIVFRRNCALLLWTLKKHGIRHGDLTTKNIIVKNNKPMLVDFHQSKFEHEAGADKRPEGDAYWMWESALELSPDTSRHIRKWRAIRPFIKNDNDDVFDFGCAEGDYCLFARSENVSTNILGYDTNYIALNIAQENWNKYNCGFVSAPLPDFSQYGIVFFMSVFAHINPDKAKR